MKRYAVARSVYRSLAVTTLSGASRSLNPALRLEHCAPLSPVVTPLRWIPGVLFGQDPFPHGFQMRFSSSISVHPWLLMYY